jgi:Fe-S-cluster containining protein
MTIYECDKCGACCRTLLVEAYELDVLREPRLVAADTNYASLSLEQTLETLQDEFHCLIIAGPGRPCAFLDDNGCSIYPTRPNTCVAMLPGDETCQEVRAAEGLLPLRRADQGAVA